MFLSRARSSLGAGSVHVPHYSHRVFTWCRMYNQHSKPSGSPDERILFENVLFLRYGQMALHRADVIVHPHRAVSERSRVCTLSAIQCR